MKKIKKKETPFFFLPTANRIDVWQPNLLLVSHLLSFVFVVTWIPPSPHTLDSPTSSSSSSLKNLIIFSSAPHVPKPAPRTCPFLFISNYITTMAPLHTHMNAFMHDILRYLIKSVLFFSFLASTFEQLMKYLDNNLAPLWFNYKPWLKCMVSLFLFFFFKWTKHKDKKKAIILIWKKYIVTVRFCKPIIINHCNCIWHWSIIYRKVLQQRRRE